MSAKPLKPSCGARSQLPSRYFTQPERVQHCYSHYVFVENRLENPSGEHMKEVENWVARISTSSSDSLVLHPSYTDRSTTSFPSAGRAVLLHMSKKRSQSAGTHSRGSHRPGAHAATFPRGTSRGVKKAGPVSWPLAR